MHLDAAPDEALTLRSVPPARALDWLAHGWRLFVRDPGVWLAQSVILLVVLAAVGVVPLIGWAVVIVSFPILAAGMVYGAAVTARGGRPGVAMIFEGLRQQPARLAIVGVCYLVGALFALMISLGVGASAALTGYLVGTLAGFGLGVGGMVLASAVFSVLWVVLVMALWFAPALVMLRAVAPLEAMRLSLRACLANLLTFALLALLLYVLVWVAMLPAGLGMLVLSPVMAGALYRAYHDVFGEPFALPPPSATPACADH